ncbi:DUF6897 domain-containing protein [Fictibacillus barbaricus]|uniref:Spore coat protein B n=1 Tax=Fictibacillus barbaricus TaxID=182136 RepID=A0ABU1U0I0_9BACL|nr:hypothetical protein [Fictibacillus barbaricus]MDR7072957.1 spore coat protein B [Fictibacillus barbaricus]
MKEHTSHQTLTSGELVNLLGQFIRVNTGGHESRVGRLVCVGKNFIAIETDKRDGDGKGKGKGKGKDESSSSSSSSSHHKKMRRGRRSHKQVIFYQLDHVKAIIIEADELCCWTNPKKVSNDTFRDVIKHFINHKVKINRGGPDSIEGVLVAVRGNTLQIIDGDNVIFVTIFHIKSFSEIGGCREEMPGVPRRSESSSSSSSHGKKRK